MEYYGTSFWAPTNTLSHHGIKGQKWGVRHWQNADGTFNEAGKKRYFGNGSGEGYKKLSRKEKKEIRKEYWSEQKKRNAELRKINEKHDKAKTENIWSLDGGGATQRVKKHLENEYKRSQEINKWDQKNLDAKRAYREKIGKKKVETWLMRAQQDAINEISNQTQAEFNKEYAEYILRQAMSAVNNARSSGG